MFMRFASLATAATFAIPVYAQNTDTDVLFDLLQMPEMIGIMREEGLGYGESIGTDLFAGSPSPEWMDTVSRIYDYDLMVAVVREDFEASFAQTDVTPIIEFYETPLGQEIVSLEVSARRALLDDEVGDVSKEAVAQAANANDPRVEQVSRFVQVNNLIETNVAGALNSNLAFYMGLMDGGAFGDTLNEEQILTDVWSQEADIRDNTTEWIMSFLYLAYQPLSDEELQLYIDKSATPEGEALNRAMFESFDRLFEGISRNLGRAAAFEMTSQEL